jgi:hypothetical protein
MICRFKYMIINVFSISVALVMVLLKFIQQEKHEI